jgi:hypothetical protein
LASFLEIPENEKRHLAVKQKDFKLVIMKTTEDHFTGRLRKLTLNRTNLIITNVLMFILLFTSGTLNLYPQEPAEHTVITPPAWAPPYNNVNEVRYYYFPDIECYYDVWTHEFIYLEDGSWMFGSTLPPSYSWFDLNTAYIVFLNSNVYEPWRHFHYYVSHYPRYYYRSFYNDWDDIYRPIRGFNENERVAIYNNRNIKEENNRNIKEENNRNIIEENNRKIVKNNNSNENIIKNEAREEVKTNREFPERRVAATRPPQKMHYYGKNIGHPVSVQRKMMKPHVNGGRRK